MVADESKYVTLPGNSGLMMITDQWHKATGALHRLCFRTNRVLVAGDGFEWFGTGFFPGETFIVGSTKAGVEILHPRWNVPRINFFSLQRLVGTQYVTTSWFTGIPPEPVFPGIVVWTPAGGQRHVVSPLLSASDFNAGGAYSGNCSGRY